MRCGSLYLTAGLVAVALSACGGDDGKLSAAEAKELLATLNSVERHFESEDCEQASAGAATLQGQVRLLDRSVDPDLSDALSAGARRLGRLVASQCEPSPSPVPSTGAAPTVASPNELERQRKEAEKEAEKREKEADKRRKEAQKEEDKRRKEAEKLQEED